MEKHIYCTKSSVNVESTKVDPESIFNVLNPNVRWMQMQTKRSYCSVVDPHLRRSFLLFALTSEDLISWLQHPASVINRSVHLKSTPIPVVTFTSVLRCLRMRQRAGWATPAPHSSRWCSTAGRSDSVDLRYGSQGSDSSRRGGNETNVWINGEF